MKKLGKKFRKNNKDKRLQLVKYKDELTSGALFRYYGQHKDKVYVFMGEFAHAPWHCLLMEFGTWTMSGMHEMNNLELLDKHPDDVEIILDDSEMTQDEINEEWDEQGLIPEVSSFLDEVAEQLDVDRAELDATIGLTPRDE